jgi:hypothetical protein
MNQAHTHSAFPRAYWVSGYQHGLSVVRTFDDNPWPSGDKLWRVRERAGAIKWCRAVPIVFYILVGDYRHRLACP